LKGSHHDATARFTGRLRRDIYTMCSGQGTMQKSTMQKGTMPKGAMQKGDMQKARRGFPPGLSTKTPDCTFLSESRILVKRNFCAPSAT
jgi:hypothetical protein